MPSIKWNPQVKILLSDVDETVADLYVPAEKEMTLKLSTLLEEGIVLFFITGQSIDSVKWRIINQIRPNLRKKLLVSHCSGAEVFGFDEKGEVLKEPFYSLYDNALNLKQKKIWRDIISTIISEFKIKTYKTMPVAEFKKTVGDNPLAIMLEDRGPQITFEVINGYDLEAEVAQKLEFTIPQTHGAYDLRIPIMERADQLFIETGIPITPRVGGVFAVDFALKGVSKETSVRKVLVDGKILNHVGLMKADIENPECLEIWGDKFSEIRGGSDRHMCEAVDAKVRAIDFREENPEEFNPKYNIVVWDGKKHLHEGLLEYLKSYH